MDKLTIQGLKQRLRSLERKAEYTDISAVKAAITMLWHTLSKEDVRLLKELGFAMPYAREGRLFIPAYFSNLKPIYGKSPRTGNQSQHIILGYTRVGDLFPQTLVEVLHKRLPPIQARLRWLHTIGRFHSSAKHREEVTQLEEQQAALGRLFLHEDLFKQCAEPLRLGLENKWPEIVECRAEIAKREKLDASRVLAPIAPSRDEVLRALGVAAAGKSREQVEALREKIPVTTECPYCLTTLVVTSRHLDHIVPIARGGLTTADNLVWVCEPCNLKKSDRSLFEFAAREGLDREDIIDRLHELGKRIG